MTLIPKDKPQLISFLNRQPSLVVLDMFEGRPSDVAASLKRVSADRVVVVVIKG